MRTQRVVTYYGAFGEPLIWILDENVEDEDEFIRFKAWDMGVDPDPCDFVTLDSPVIEQKEIDLFFSQCIDEDKFHIIKGTAKCKDCKELFNYDKGFLYVNGESYGTCPNCEYIKTGKEYWK